MNEVIVHQWKQKQTAWNDIVLLLCCRWSWCVWWASCWSSTWKRNIPNSSLTWRPKVWALALWVGWYALIQASVIGDILSSVNFIAAMWMNFILAHFRVHMNIPKMSIFLLVMLQLLTILNCLHTESNIVFGILVGFQFWSSNCKKFDKIYY